MLFTAALSTPSLLLASCSHMKGGREMDDECINWGWHSFPGQMRPAEAGRPPDLECGRGWRDSLTLVRSAFAFYSQTPSQKRKGVQYCTQCNGLPDTALIHIHLGWDKYRMTSRQERTRTSYVTRATLGARDLLERGRPWPDPSPRVRSLVRSLSITVIFTAVLHPPPFSSASRK